MLVKSVRRVHAHAPVKTADCFVGDGYLQGPGGSLPDVDCDFQSDRRQEVKAYIERRYNHDGKRRVFSAGTFTTLKLKAALKDVSRVYRVPVSTVNYITSIIEDDKASWTDLFILAHENKKLRKFIEDYSRVIEDIRALMGQPRSSSIHASALLVTPDTKDGEDMECFDFTPIKKVDGVLVSEFDGYTLDDQGLLKNDCLGIKELSKIQAVLALCNNECGAELTFEGIVKSGLDDKRVYELLREGATQNVFQFSSKGMTKFLMEMQPTCIDDLIAANALFRPATLESGSTKRYVDCKRGDAEPSYLWGTRSALNDTYGVLCYQEQLAQMAREVGGLSLSEGVKLVKFISKKKQAKIDEYKEKFLAGAKSKGCPDKDAEAVWSMFQVAGAYCFNKSHATAYAVTAYVGAYLKAKYPTAFYTVALQWADDDDIPLLMSEMERCSVAKVVPPDINMSSFQFTTDYKNNYVYWSLTRIKMLGLKASQWIVDERNARGKYKSVSDFIDRVFRYKLKRYQYWDDPDDPDEAVRCPVNARHVRHLVLSGCFDKVEDVKDVTERYGILVKAADALGFVLDEKEAPCDLRDKHYFWSQRQIAVCGVGSVDYRRVFDCCRSRKDIKGRAVWATLSDISRSEYDGRRVALCATIVEMEEKRYTDKKTGEAKLFCKAVLQQNSQSAELIMWSEEWAVKKQQFAECGMAWVKNRLIVCTAMVRHSDYTGKNALQIYKSSIIEII